MYVTRGIVEVGTYGNSTWSREMPWAWLCAASGATRRHSGLWRVCTRAVRIVLVDLRNGSHTWCKNRLGGPQKRLPHLVASPGRELVLEDVHELDRREAEVTGDGVSHRVGGGREVFVPRDVAVEVVVSTK